MLEDRLGMVALVVELRKSFLRSFAETGPDQNPKYKEFPPESTRLLANKRERLVLEKDLSRYPRESIGRKLEFLLSFSFVPQRPKILIKRFLNLRRDFTRGRKRPDYPNAIFGVFFSICHPHKTNFSQNAQVRLIVCVSSWHTPENHMIPPKSSDLTGDKQWLPS